MCEFRQFKVEHVFFRPHLPSAVVGTIVVLTLGSQFQRNLIFIIVVVVVAAKTYEYCKLVVSELGGVLLKGVGMDKHLHSLILAKVERCGLIYSLGFAVLHVVDRDVQSLLVVLDKLRLRRVGDATYARRKHIVDRSLVGVFLDIYGACFHSASRRVCSKSLLVGSPFTSHEVKAAESQYYRFLKVS